MIRRKEYAKSTGQQVDKKTFNNVNAANWPDDETVQNAPAAVVAKSSAIQNRMGIEARTDAKLGRSRIELDTPYSSPRPSSEVALENKPIARTTEHHKKHLRISESPSVPSTSTQNMVIAEEPTLSEDQLAYEVDGKMRISSLESKSHRLEPEFRQNDTLRSHHPVQLDQGFSMVNTGLPQTSNLEFTSQPKSVHNRTSSGVVAPASHDAFTMLNLMRTSCGRVQSHAFFRKNERDPWSNSFCSINDSGSLRSQVERADTLLATLLYDIRGCRTTAFYDDFVRDFVLHVRSLDGATLLYLRPHQSRQFNMWFAAFLCWQPVLTGQALQFRSKRNHLERIHTFAEHEHYQIKQSQNAFPSTRHQSLTRDCDTIMACIATFVEVERHTSSAISSSASSSTGNVYSNFHTHSEGDTTSTRVSCILQADGRLKLNSSNHDGMEPLSLQLARTPCSAIQRLDHSVFNKDFVMGIYPQYVSQAADCSRLRPIYIQFDSQSQHDFWYALLQSYSCSEVYGSQQLRETEPYTFIEDIPDSNPNTPAALFRVEMKLNISVKRIDLRSLGMTQGALSGLRRGAGGKSKPNLNPMEDCYAEILLDEQVRARTLPMSITKATCTKGSFQFYNLPSLFPSITIRLKRSRVSKPSKISQDQSAQTSFNASLKDSFLAETEEISHPFLMDDPVGEAVIEIADLGDDFEVEKTFPILDHSTTLGTTIVNISRNEKTILMEPEYEQISNLLGNFDDNLTSKIWHHIPTCLSELAERFLNVFQASDKALQWFSHLIEEEVHSGIQRPAPLKQHLDEHAVATDSAFDMSKAQKRKSEPRIEDVSVLFRANTLLTRGLDIYMKRHGAQFLEETLGPKIRELMNTELGYEVNPNRSALGDVELDSNWQNLIRLTEEIWRLIYRSASRCPLELKVLFKKVRTCAQGRYGHISPTVGYTSVSGFLFLRFFVAAVMTPQAFGLIQSSPNPNVHRALVLVAKGLQGLANMTPFGDKESWMLPMNKFCASHNAELREFVDKICSIPDDGSGKRISKSSGSKTAAVSMIDTVPDSLQHLSSKTGSTSMPNLIDRASNLAALVDLWLHKEEAMAHENNIKASKHGSASTSTSVTSTENDATLKQFDNACKDIRRRAHAYRQHANTTKKHDSAISHKWVSIAEHIEAEPGQYWLSDQPSDLVSGLNEDPPVRRKPKLAQPSPGKEKKQKDRPKTDQGRRGSTLGSSYSTGSSSKGKKKGSPERGPEEIALRKLGWIM